MADFDDRSGRDSRLLALVIVIAVAVLLLLARFRFPQSDARPAAVTPGPLERLAARATYDDLASAVHSTLQRVEPALVLVTVEPDAPAGKPRPMAGIRLDGEWAVVHVPAGFHIAKSSPEDPLVVRQHDATKEVAFVTRPLASGEDQLPSGSADLSSFAYVCVVEPLADTATASPWFIGRVRSLLDERWNAGVTVPGGSLAIPPGALVFQLDGRFLGLAIHSSNGGSAIVPASLLQANLSTVRGGVSGGSR